MSTDEEPKEGVVRGSPAEYPRLKVERNESWAVGVPAIVTALAPAIEHMGLARTTKLYTKINQKDGFDCMSCAWPDPDERKTLEFCENGARAVTWEATPVLVPDDFWAEHPVTDLDGRSEYWLGMQGRLTRPVYKPADSDQYEIVSWERAFSIIAEHLRGLDSADAAAFYTSGRTANETAFIYQLFARAFGTNNLPDCSNMCHESSGRALTEVIGVGKSTIAYDDFERTDLVVVMGENPGTNAPRALTALEDVKRHGGSIVAVNPLPEPGLIRYKNPQRPRGIIGKGTPIADQYLKIRVGGDMALLQALSKRVLAAERAKPGSVLDHAFLTEHTVGLDEFEAHLADLDESAVLAATGLRSEEIDELAERYLRADKVIISWGMGLTQHRNAVATLKEIVNLLLLRGNIGKPGAGVSPIRGHSNVQGDRTMGIWEQMPPTFLDALQREFGFDPPREPGLDAVNTIRGMQRGAVKVFFAMGGNFVSAIADTHAAEAAMRGTELSVQVSTKLNRSHAVTGRAAMILPTLGRTEFDLQESGPQFVSVEDTVCAVHATHGAVPPVAEGMLSEVAIVSRLARAVLGDDSPIDWASFERDYDVIREPHQPRHSRLRELQRTRATSGRFRAAERPPRLTHLRHRSGQGDDHRQRARTPRPARRPADPADPARPRSVQYHRLLVERPLPRHPSRTGCHLREPRRPRRAGHRRWRSGRHPQRMGRRRRSRAPSLPRRLLSDGSGMRRHLLPRGERARAAGFGRARQQPARIQGAHRAARTRSREHGRRVDPLSFATLPCAAQSGARSGGCRRAVDYFVTELRDAGFADAGFAARRRRPADFDPEPARGERTVFGFAEAAPPRHPSPVSRSA